MIQVVNGSDLHSAIVEPISSIDFSYLIYFFHSILTVQLFKHL